MNVQLLAGIERICSRSDSEIEHELGSLLAEPADSRPMTVRAARDGFTGLLLKARSGRVQLVGKKTDEQAVIMSVATLAGLIKAASGIMSAGDFLAATGFKASGGRIVHHETNDTLAEPDYEVRSREHRDHAAAAEA